MNNKDNKDNKNTKVVAIRRSKDKIIQDCDVYIGRKCYMGGWKLEESPFHNPFTIKQCGSAQKAIRKYEIYLRKRKDLLELLPKLEGKVLGCWCKKIKTPNAPCHGDVIVKLINELHN